MKAIEKKIIPTYSGILPSTPWLFSPLPSHYTIPATMMMMMMIINVIRKEAEKILKYKDHTIEIQRIWNVRTKVISVIIGATGTISKSFRKYVSNIPGKYEGTTENGHIGHCTHNSGKY